MGIGVKFPTLPVLPSSPEADAALHPLQDATLGSLTMYVVPETSSLLPQVGSSTLWCQSLRASPLGGGMCHRWLSQVALCRSQDAAPSPHPIPSHPQGINAYVGKHRSALVRAGGSLAALQARLREVTQVMSFTASSIAAALSDRVPDGQLSPDARRYLKSSLGMDVPSIPVSWLQESFLSLGKIPFLLCL